MVRESVTITVVAVDLAGNVLADLADEAQVPRLVRHLDVNRNLPFFHRVSPP